MAEGLLGRKRGMTQIFTEKGQVVPVTVLEVGPCFITQIKSSDREGYAAVQIGFEETRKLNVKIPLSVGVPDNSPVSVSKFMPIGSSPVVVAVKGTAAMIIVRVT